MALLASKEAILAAGGRETVEFEVPEWGGSVILREMTGKERDRYEQSLMEIKGNVARPSLDNVRARLVSLCIVDQNGDPLFVTKQEIATLGNMSAKGLDRVYEKCQEMNGLDAGAVEELVTDFGSDQSDGSTAD